MTERKKGTKKRPGDVDAPLTDDEFERGMTAMATIDARTETGLTQEGFAARYGIPVATLREWEQGRRKPDSASQSYLRAIENDPVAVANALHKNEAA